MCRVILYEKFGLLLLLLLAININNIMGQFRVSPNQQFSDMPYVFLVIHVVLRLG